MLVDSPITDLRITLYQLILIFIISSPQVFIPSFALFLSTCRVGGALQLAIA